MNVKQIMENVIIVVMTTMVAIIVHVNLDTDFVKMERLVKVFIKNFFGLFQNFFVPPMWKMLDIFGVLKITSDGYPRGH